MGNIEITPGDISSVLCRLFSQSRSFGQSNSNWKLPYLSMQFYTRHYPSQIYCIISEQPLAVHICFNVCQVNYAGTQLQAFSKSIKTIFSYLVTLWQAFSKPMKIIFNYLSPLLWTVSKLIKTIFKIFLLSELLHELSKQNELLLL